MCTSAATRTSCIFARQAQPQPRPFSPPISPASFSAPPPFEPHPEASRRGTLAASSAAGKRKKGGKPARTVRCSSPRAKRPRSRTLSNAERPAAWPVEDGVWSVVSGGDGGVVWWSSVVEWCLVQNNESERKTTT